MNSHRRLNLPSWRPPHRSQKMDDGRVPRRQCQIPRVVQEDPSTQNARLKSFNTHQNQQEIYKNALRQVLEIRPLRQHPVLLPFQQVPLSPKRAYTNTVNTKLVTSRLACIKLSVIQLPVDQEIQLLHLLLWFLVHPSLQRVPYSKNKWAYYPVLWFFRNWI